MLPQWELNAGPQPFMSNALPLAIKACAAWDQMVFLPHPKDGEGTLFVSSQLGWGVPHPH